VPKYHRATLARTRKTKMTEEEARKLPVDPHQSADVPNEFELQPDPEVVGVEQYKNLMKRIDKTIKAHGYHVVVPCCRCVHCIVVREMRMGQIVNVGYGCSYRRIPCDAYGTCEGGYSSQRGPMVLVRKLEGGQKTTDFKNLPGDVWSVEPPKEVPKAVLSGKQKVVPKNLNS